MVADTKLFSKWAASSENVPNGLSRCHNKRRVGAPGHAPPSFGMTPTVYIFFFGKENWKNFDLFILFIYSFFFLWKSRCLTKTRMGALF